MATKHGGEAISNGGATSSDDLLRLPNLNSNLEVFLFFGFNFFHFFCFLLCVLVLMI